MSTKYVALAALACAGVACGADYGADLVGVDHDAGGRALRDAGSTDQGGAVDRPVGVDPDRGAAPDAGPDARAATETGVPDATAMRPASTGPLRGTFRVVTQATGNCWDIPGQSEVSQNPCRTRSEQLFDFVPAGDGTYRIVNRWSQGCLAPEGPTDGSIVASAPCADRPEQLFTLHALEGGRYRLGTNQPGQCVEVTAGSSVRRAHIQSWRCNGSPAQEWQLHRQFPATAYRLVQAHSGKCANVPGATLVDGTELVQLDCLRGPATLFQILERMPNVFQLVNVATTKCVDVRAGNAAEGAAVQQFLCSGAPTQLFRIESVGEHDRLINLGSDACVALAGSSLLDGAPLEQRTCNDEPPRLWKLSEARVATDAGAP